MPKDYYKILELEKSASSEEIKKAFRKLAHKYHPDKPTGDESKFKEVNEAFQVLGNEEKRKQYDQFGSTFDQQGGFGGDMNWEDFMRAARSGGGGFKKVNFDFGGIDLGDIFGDIFGFGGGQSSTRRRGRGNDIQVDLSLDFNEAVFGTEKEIRLTKNNDCDICLGSGVFPGSNMKKCTECQGRGEIRRIQQTILGSMQTSSICTTCEGRGEIPEKACVHCGGDGRVRSESKYNIKIPAGIDDGEAIRLVGKGESVGNSGQTGDLYIRVHVRDSNDYTRDGNDIYTEEHISYPQAVLGDKIIIKTLDGNKKLVIPSGTQSHQQFKLKNLGVPRLNRGGRGDHYVKIIVDVPKKAGRKLKKLLDEISEEL